MLQAIARMKLDQRTIWQVIEYCSSA